MLELGPDVFQEIGLARVVAGSAGDEALNVGSELLKTHLNRINDLVFAGDILSTIDVVLNFGAKRFKPVLDSIENLLGVPPVRGGVLLEFDTHAIDQLVELLQDLLAEAVEWNGGPVDAGLNSIEEVIFADLQFADGLFSEALSDGFKDTNAGGLVVQCRGSG